MSAFASHAAAGRQTDRGELGAAFGAVRARLALVALLIVLAGAAWWSTAARMAGMDAGPGTALGSLGWFLGVWVVMMAAMMFPALAPTAALYATMTRRNGHGRAALFTASYLVIWGAAGLVAYGVFELGRGLFGGALAWHAGGQWLAAGVLAAAAVYELTPLKDACLSRCRSPLAFLLGNWRDGSIGAVEMGSRHAAWCLGCCWALMAGLFALGIMSIVWMALVASLIVLEKTLPWRRTVTWATAAILLVLAVGILVAPHSVPGFTVPSGAHGGGAMHTMNAMQ